MDQDGSGTGEERVSAAREQQREAADRAEGLCLDAQLDAAVAGLGRLRARAANLKARIQGLQEEYARLSQELVYQKMRVALARQNLRLRVRDLPSLGEDA